MTDFQTIKTPKGELKLFNSFSPQRLKHEGETLDEYHMRRAAIKSHLKGKKKGNLIHISSALIPKMDLEGGVELGPDGNPIWIGKSKGTTYVKGNEEEEHMSLVEHFKNIKKDESGREQSE